MSSTQYDELVLGGLGDSGRVVGKPFPISRVMFARDSGRVASPVSGRDPYTSKLPQ